MVGLAAVAVVVGQASAALATPATPPTAEVTVNETLQPVLHGLSTSAGSGSHSINFYARTVGSSTWNLLNDVSVAGTEAYQQLPAGQLSIGQAFEYQIADCDSSGCATSAIQTGYVSPDLAAGDRPGATRLPFTIGDRVSAQVDVGTGNLYVSTTQLSLQRISGSLDLGMVYNGLTLAPGSRSSSTDHGWRFTTGSAIGLQSYPNGSVVYSGPNGLTGTFTPTGATTYASPPTIKGTLVKNSDGSWDLTMHDSGDVSHFNSAGQLVQLTDRSNQANNTGNATTFGYNGHGQLTQVQTDKGTTGARTVTVTSVAYGSPYISGLSQAPSGAAARSVSYGYDAQWRLQQITDVLNRATTFGYNSAGDLTSITAPGGAETDFTYDAAHRVTAVTQPSASGTNAVTRLVYNTAQTLVANPTTDQSQAVSAVPHTTYDLKTDGPTAGLLLVGTATDPTGAKRSATYTNFSDVATAQNSSGTTTFGHDPQTGNNGESLTSIQSPTTAKSSFSYGTSGSPSQYEVANGTDAQGNVTQYAYDNQTGAPSGSTDQSGAQAQVTRNNDGTVATSVSPNQATTTYTYVQVNGVSTKQVSTITPPSGNSLGVRTYTYDPYGRIATYQSGRYDTANPPQPIVQTFHYDAADRVTEVDYSDGTPSVIYTFTDAGQVRTRSDGSGQTTYDYDPLGRLASRTHTAGGGLLTYTYDLDGNLVSENDGNGTTTETYDSRDLLTSTTTPDGKVIAFHYDDNTRRTDTWFNTTGANNNSWAAHTKTVYDASGRISEVWTARASNDSTKVSDLSYSYVAPSSSSCSTVTVAQGTDTGLRWTQTDNITGLTTSYCYDHANRLTDATTPGGDSWHYSYDAGGNRTQVTKNGTAVQSFQPFNSANQISSADGYTYDAAGNLTATPGSVNLSYNGSDQLTGRSGNSTGSYTYAGTDQTELISQVVPGASTWSYTYGRTDQNGLPIIDSLTNPNGTSYLTHDAQGNPLAIKTYQGTTSYYVLDGLGSPIALVNGLGTLQATYSYDPWGNVTISNPTNSTAATLQPYRFAGGMLDRSTNYVKFGMRYYDPATGRFTQQDSLEVLGDPSRGNRYEYAGDNPSNYVDPAGRWTWDQYISGVISTGLGTVAGELALPLTPIGAGFVGGCVGTASYSYLISGGSTSNVGTACLQGGAVGASAGALGWFITWLAGVGLS